MTSSYKATSAASVRQTPASAVPNPAAWALTELAAHAPSVPVRHVPPLDSQVSAAEKARLINEGYVRGLADAEKKAAAAAADRVAEAMALVTEITNSVREVASLAPAILEENVAALAVIVARQIVAREVSLSRELVGELVRRALTEFPVEQSVRIRVNPHDLALLTLGSERGQDTTPITKNRDASWLADPRVARGGCLVEGRDRIVDGRIDTALERAYRRMAEIDAS